MTKESICSTVKTYMAVLDFPEKAQKELALALEKLVEDETCLALLQRDLAIYKESYQCDYKEMLTELAAESERAGVPAASAYMIFYLSLLDELRAYYRAANIDDKIFLDSAADLRFKVNESMMVDGVAGIRAGAATGWYPALFRTEIRFFSRLQFVFGKFNFECECDGVKLENDSPVLHIHIPRTGTKLSHDEVLESYRLAAEHYREAFGDHPIVFTTRTWLLWPRNMEFLKPDSNLALFYKDFEIVDHHVYGDYSQVWRLFDCEYTGDVDALPQDTSLRRAYAEIIRRGESVGFGRGVFIYR